MKRVVVAVIAILLLSVLLYAGDDKAVKKEAQKPCQGICAGHDSVKCALEKGSAACVDKHAKSDCKDKCTLVKGSAACLEKHKKDDCKGHEAGKCSPECLEKCGGHEKPPK